MAQYPILNGPSKFDLMIALFQGETNHQQKVKFRVKFPTITIDCQVRITALAREDGSGECWNFEGYHVAVGAKPFVKGFFDLRKRTGHINIEH